MVEFEVSATFARAYDAVDDSVIDLLDAALLRVVGEPGSGWARQSRVMGDFDWAWKVTIEAKGRTFAIYWTQNEDGVVQFVALVEPR